MSLSLAARRARLLTVRDQVDIGGGGAVHLYASPMAESPETPAASAPLAIVALAEVCGTLHATAAQLDLVPAVGYAAQSGVPAWARFVDGNGAPVYDCTAGLPGSGAVLIITDGQEPPSHQMYVGGEITVTATLTEP